MKTYKLVFSPTGGTAKVADAIAQTWADAQTVDLSAPDFKSASFEEDALVLIAMPAFGGLAPETALGRMIFVYGNGAKCALVAVYGNRAYEDTLIQMEEYAVKSGFNVIAAVSAVAEHSIIREIAAGRPNADDCSQLAEFGRQILAKAENGGGEVVVPGNRPYKNPGAAMVPKAGAECINCGLCAKQCPTGAIDPEDLCATDNKECIGCMRCVSNCPVHNRGLGSVVTKMVKHALKKPCAEPKPNELFI